MGETKLLQTIDKLKIQANSSNRDAKIKKTLESMSKPKVWAQSDGETTTVHTPFTTRAKELTDLYTGLRLPLLTVDERLDVLLHVKWTVKEFDCNLTREIVDLIDAKRICSTVDAQRSHSQVSGGALPICSFNSLRRRSSIPRPCASRRLQGSCMTSLARTHLARCPSRDWGSDLSVAECRLGSVLLLSPASTEAAHGWLQQRRPSDSAA